MSRLLTVLFLLAALPAQAAVPPHRNSKAPIDITADRLEVLQADNKAIFTGHVVAVQADIRLTSDKMTVYYRKQEEKKAKTKAAVQQNAIRRIEVDGNVFMATPEETAAGASGVYDVERDQITLNKDVVLTRDKNTLKGDHLVYDLATGKSIVTSDGAPAEGTKSGRVRALFVPDEKDKKQP